MRTPHQNFELITNSSFKFRFAINYRFWVIVKTDWHTQASLTNVWKQLYFGKGIGVDIVLDNMTIQVCTMYMVHIVVQGEWVFE